MTQVLEHVDGDLLIDRLILGQKHAEPHSRRRRRRGPATAVSRQLFHRFVHSRDRTEQFGLADGFEQDGREAELLAAFVQIGSVRRRQEDDLQIRTGRFTTDPLGELISVHPGHHSVEQGEVEGVSPSRRLAMASSASGPPATETQIAPQLARISSRIRRFVLLSSTIRDVEALDFRCEAPPLGYSSFELSESNREGKGTALADLRVNADHPPHQPDELGRDGEPQPRAAEPARGRTVGLLERSEDRLELLRRNADAGIRHGDPDNCSVVVVGFDCRCHDDLAGRR